MTADRPATDTTVRLTSRQMRELHALLRDHGITGDATVHDYLNMCLEEHDDEQYPLESRADLAGATAARIIRDLRNAPVSRAPGGLARALIEVQKALPVVQKTKTANVPTKAGGSYSYTYADLGDVTDAAMPLLTSHGLAFSCCPRATDRGYELVGVLMHESGETREGALPLHGNDPQQIGGAITYHRRYLLGSMLGIVTDDDADGRQAVGTARTRAWDGPSTPEILNAIDADAQRAGVDYETATAKWRQQRGLSLDDLDGLDPWVLSDLAAAIKVRADQVVAERAAAEARVPASGEAERPGDRDAGDVPGPADWTADPSDPNDPWAAPKSTP